MRAPATPAPAVAPGPHVDVDVDGASSAAAREAFGLGAGAGAGADTDAEATVDGADECQWVPLACSDAAGVAVGVGDGDAEFRVVGAAREPVTDGDGEMATVVVASSVTDCAGLPVTAYVA